MCCERFKVFSNNKYIIRTSDLGTFCSMKQPKRNLCVKYINTTQDL